jgi:hypothetical protein
MTFTVYALRLKGETEVRYIGLTNGDPQNRVCNLRSCEVGLHRASLFGQWLDSHYGDIEALTLATCKDRSEGKAAEIEAITMAVKTGQRLFYRDQVPKAARISSDRLPYRSVDQRAFDARHESQFHATTSRFVAPEWHSPQVPLQGFRVP